MSARSFVPTQVRVARYSREIDIGEPLCRKRQPPEPFGASSLSGEDTHVVLVRRNVIHSGGPVCPRQSGQPFEPLLLQPIRALGAPVHWIHDKTERLELARRNSVCGNTSMTFRRIGSRGFSSGKHARESAMRDPCAWVPAMDGVHPSEVPQRKIVQKNELL